jgi:hypothetical protein
MQRVWRYSLAAGIAAIATAALCASLDYIINRETQVKNSVAAASRIVVTKYLLTPVVPTDPKSDLSWQIYMMNRGLSQDILHNLPSCLDWRTVF